MEEVDLAWPVYKGLKSVGLEPADYPAISAWMAKKVLSGLSPAPAQVHNRQQHMHTCFRLQTALLWPNSMWQRNDSPMFIL